LFFYRSATQVTDFNNSIKRDPRTNMRSPNTSWAFWSLLPEALHQATRSMSHRGIPKTLRDMHGFESHTFSMINEQNERTWVKFHMRSQQGIENLTDEEAAAIVGVDSENNQRDV